METGNWNHTAHLNLAGKDDPSRRVSDSFLGWKWAGDPWIADSGRGMCSRQREAKGYLWCQGSAAQQYRAQLSAVLSAPCGCCQLSLEALLVAHAWGTAWT